MSAFSNVKAVSGTGQCLDLTPVKGLSEIERLIAHGQSFALVEYTPTLCKEIWDKYTNEFNRRLNRKKAHIYSDYIDQKAFMPFASSIVFGKNKEGHGIIVDGHERIFGGAQASHAWICQTQFTNMEVTKILAIDNGKAQTVADMARFNGIDLPNTQNVASP